MLISVTLPFLNIPLTTRVCTSKKLKLIIPSPSSSRALKVSGTNRSKHLNSPLPRGELKLPSARTRTHWRAAPSESGSTQSCQSRRAGPGCSGPRWSDAGGCWGRTLPTHNMWSTVIRAACLGLTSPHQQPPQPSSSQRRSCSRSDPRLCLCRFPNVDTDRLGLRSLAPHSRTRVGNRHKPGTYQEFLNLCPQDPEFYQPQFPAPVFL